MSEGLGIGERVGCGRGRRDHGRGLVRIISVSHILGHTVAGWTFIHSTGIS